MNYLIIAPCGNHARSSWKSYHRRGNNVFWPGFQQNSALHHTPQQRNVWISLWMKNFIARVPNTDFPIYSYYLVALKNEISVEKISCRYRFYDFTINSSSGSWREIRDNNRKVCWPEILNKGILIMTGKRWRSTGVTRRIQESSNRKIFRRHDDSFPAAMGPECDSAIKIRYSFQIVQRKTMLSWIEELLCNSSLAERP